MVFSAIIWNAAYQYRYDILYDIMQSYPVSNICEYNLTDVYPQFVRDVYKSDNIPEYRINQKLNYMDNFANSSVWTFDVNIEKLTTEYMPRKQRHVFVEPEQLKAGIRKKYSTLIQPYFFDIILHMTENKEEKTSVDMVLKKYAQLKKQIFVNSKDKKWQK